ncbi:MAG TPA: molybdenum cofactor guanylyltransferase [Ktedonobacterales bacterium]
MDERRGPADESAPRGLRPPSPPVRAGIEPRGAGALEEAPGDATLGVVLAGGLSRRMGELGPKAALSIGGERLLARVVRRLRAGSLREVLVVGPPELGAQVPGVPVVADRRPGAHGPLAGLETALLWASAATAEHPDTPYRRVFVVACDMPFVAPALVRAMVARAARTPEAEADALVLRSATGTEQLHAVYSLVCLPVATALLDSGARSLRELLARLRTVEYPAAEAARDDPSGLSAFNANTPDDWQRALDLAAEEGE